MDKFEEARSVKQKLTFNSTREFFKTCNLPFGVNEQKALNIISPGGVYTYLGYMLSDQAEHTVKLAIFEGQDKDLLKEKKEFSGSILKQLADIYKFLDEKLNKTDYPQEALREALINALIHRDYAISGSNIISIFDDYIEYISIGGIFYGLSIEDIKIGVSVLRNEKLANVFFRLKLANACGSGISRIINSYKGFLEKPAFQAAENAFKIILPKKNSGSLDTLKVNLFFSDKEKGILALLENQGEISRKDAETALGVSQAMAVRHFHSLVKKEAINVIGSGKNTRYIRSNNKN